MVALSLDTTSILVGVFAGVTYGILGYLEGHTLKGEPFMPKRLLVTALVGAGVGALTPVTAPSDLPALVQLGVSSFGTIGTITLGQKALNIIANLYGKASPPASGTA